MAETNGNGERPSPISKHVHWKLFYRNPETNGNGSCPPATAPRLTQKVVERKSLILERE